MVSENERVERVAALLAAGDVRAVGPVLTEGHASLRDDLRVSCAELDLVVDTAVAAGALGARMTGGGFRRLGDRPGRGGRRGPVSKALTSAFEHAGLAAPRLFEAVPSAGARRVA